MSGRSDRGRGVRAGAAVRGTAPALPPDARRPCSTARAAARGLAGRLRTGDRDGPGPVPGRTGRAEPARRDRHAAAAGVPRRRLPMAGHRFRAGPRVRGPSVAGRVRRTALRGARGGCGAGVPGPAEPHRRGAHRQRRPGGADRRGRRSSGRARPRPGCRRDRRQPVGAPGIGPRDERHRTERRLRRPVHGSPFRSSARALPAARAGPPGADAAADAAGGRRPHGGCHAPVAGGPDARRRTA